MQTQHVVVVVVMMMTVVVQTLTDDGLVVSEAVLQSFKFVKTAARRQRVIELAVRSFYGACPMLTSPVLTRPYVYSPTCTPPRI